MADQRQINRIWLVDWELSRGGCPYQDLATIAAPLYWLSVFRNRVSAESMMQAFLSAYAERGKVDDVKETTIMLGMILAVLTPVYQWTDDRDAERKCVEMGLEYMRQGWEGLDKEWVENSWLKDILPSK